MSAPPQRIARLADAGRTFWAVVEESGLVRPAAGDPFKGLGPFDTARPATGLRWLPPCTPTKIIGVGRNYRAHAAELGNAVPAEPLIFLKPPSSLAGHGDVIRLPAASERVDFEGGLGVVMGRRVRDIPEERALEAVLGYTCVNDVTARDLQKKDVQFTRAKGFDTFCPAGAVIWGYRCRPLFVRRFANIWRYCFSIAYTPIRCPKDSLRSSNYTTQPFQANG